MAHVDVISDILAAAVRAFPDSAFVQGLSHQYLVRGSLSKRQLEGLWQKTASLTTLPPAKRATLEAIILKRPKKYKTPLPTLAPAPADDEESNTRVDAILARYPAHKRVLFFQAKLKGKETLSAADKAELEQFFKRLIS